MIPDLFESTDSFRNTFERGLVHLLGTTGELGEDILVLANANFDPRIWEHLRQPLRACFVRLAAEQAAADRESSPMVGAPDDVATLREILAHGFDSLNPTELRDAGGWELQFNPLRAFRPTRHGNAHIDGIHAPFDEDRFHFDKPFLRQEIIWQGSLMGRDATLFYNKFPFADYHGLLTPDLGSHRPQFLEAADFAFLWDIAQALGERMPGFGLGYNSYGAHASVNHLHFQTFLRDRPLPIANPRWRHNGGTEPYPCRCLRFDAAAQREAAAFIAELHRAAISYNLILVAGSLYCLPRRRQSDISRAPWLPALAWYEMAGGFPLASRDDFERLQPHAIAAQIAAADLPAASGP